MQEIFEIRDGIPVITGEGLSVPHLYALWMSDTSPDRLKARTELAYIYHSVDPRSIYRNVDVELREEVVRKDMTTLLGYTDFKVTSELEDAKEKYLSLIDTEAIRHQQALSRQVDWMTKYLNTRGEITTSKEMTEINKMIKDFKETFSSLGNAKEAAKKDIQAIASKLRGNVRVNIFDKEEFQ